MGTDIGGGLLWRVNGSEVANYGFRDNDNFPVDFTVSSPLVGVMIVAVNGSRVDGDSFNITSVFIVTDYIYSKWSNSAM